MISDKDFDHFLRNGHIDGISPGTSMEVLLGKFGDDYWYVKEIENNGLIYGIIKVGFIEFHIYNEQINGISYRPDIPFPKEDFQDVIMPWIFNNREISLVEKNLIDKNIAYKRYIVTGSSNSFHQAAGCLIGLNQDYEHHIIDTVGGVTFLLEYNEKTKQLEARQICKYYDIHKNNTNQE